MTEGDSLRTQQRREAAKKAWVTRRANASKPAPALGRPFATYPVPLRDADGRIDIATLYLPKVMTEQEAERIAGIVRTLAFTDE